MESAKPLKFTGSGVSFLVTYLVVILFCIIPIIGWALAFNYFNKWLGENVVVNGKKVAYKASFGEALKFILVSLLLIIVTLGIYVFWYTVKHYRFIADHISYTDGSGAAAPAAATPPAADAIPAVNPTPPAAPAPGAAPAPSTPPTPPTTPTPPAAPLVQ